MNAVRDLLGSAAKRLRACSDTPELEAQTLLARALQRDRAWLFAWPEYEPDERTRDSFAALVADREQGQPIAYLTGTQEFWSLSLSVTGDTLIPRPETELLVEILLALDLPGDARILDLGTGSGAVALAIASERPSWQIVATDRSPAALEVAKSNASRLGLTNLDFVAGDWFEALPADARFSAIASNPPYIAENDVHLGEGDVRFEPRTALVAGADGLGAIEKIIAGAPQHLADNGHLWLEHGADQAQRVRSLLQRDHFSTVSTQRDLAGLARCSGAQLDRK